jgi:hypothetical protein
MEWPNPKCETRFNYSVDGNESSEFELNLGFAVTCFRRVGSRYIRSQSLSPFAAKRPTER